MQQEETSVHYLSTVDTTVFHLLHCIYKWDKRAKWNFPLDLSFAFYLPAPKWITTTLSSVWQALRYFQAGRVEVKVWEQCHKNNLKFCWCFSPTGLLSLPLLLSLCLCLSPASLFLSCAHSLSVRRSLSPISFLHLFQCSFSSCSLRLSLHRWRSVQCMILIKLYQSALNWFYKIGKSISPCLHPLTKVFQGFTIRAVARI